MNDFLNDFLSKIQNDLVFAKFLSPGSKQWANDQLSFIIKVLKGQVVVCDWKARVQLALILKESFLSHGLTWHAKRVDNWIHRLTPRDLQPQRVDSPEGEGERIP